ncbi:MAG: dodecin family protein [Candidatus Cloacimonetes bacterium]|nr:dodecin family protein [Candidatus Cloacimonadota bacterium]
MFRFLEIIGISYESYDEAVKNAINELLNLQYDVHFFNIIEQRGSVKDNKIEFQVVLKVAIKQQVQANNQKGDHKLYKQNGSDPVCEWCGTVLYKHNPKQNTVVCNNCGRITNVDLTSNKLVLK